MKRLITLLLVALLSPEFASADRFTPIDRCIARSPLSSESVLVELSENAAGRLYLKISTEFDKRPLPVTVVTTALPNMKELLACRGDVSKSEPEAGACIRSFFENNPYYSGEGREYDIRKASAREIVGLQINALIESAFSESGEASWKHLESVTLTTKYLLRMRTESKWGTQLIGLGLFFDKDGVEIEKAINNQYLLMSCKSEV